MQSSKIKAFATAALLTASGASANTQNHQAFIDYYEKGQYASDILSIVNDAKSYLQTKVPSNEKLAVIFDIDDTCLSNYEILKASDFPQDREALIQAFKDKALSVPVNTIEPTLDLYRFCRENAVAVFFITGRYDDPRYMQLTEHQLKNAGFDSWEGLYYHPQNDPSFSKINQHKQVIDQGYTIVLNIGDQDRDLVGDYAQKHVKLPNPFYTLN